MASGSAALIASCAARSMSAIVGGGAVLVAVRRVRQEGLVPDLVRADPARERGRDASHDERPVRQGERVAIRPTKVGERDPRAQPLRRPHRLVVEDRDDLDLRPTRSSRTRRGLPASRTCGSRRRGAASCRCEASRRRSRASPSRSAQPAGGAVRPGGAGDAAAGLGDAEDGLCVNRGRHRFGRSTRGVVRGRVDGSGNLRADRGHDERRARRSQSAGANV